MLKASEYLFEKFEQIIGPQGPIRLVYFMSAADEHQTIETYKHLKKYCELQIRWRSKPDWNDGKNTPPPQKESKDA
jgi:hypothetical protein